MTLTGDQFSDVDAEGFSNLNEPAQGRRAFAAQNRPEVRPRKTRVVGDVGECEAFLIREAPDLPHHACVHGLGTSGHMGSLVLVPYAGVRYTG